MTRPRDSSYRSYKIIREALSSGSKYFKELEDLTNLHRNTLNHRLNFLISEGLVKRNRIGHRVYYSFEETPNEGLLKWQSSARWYELTVPLVKRRRQERQLKRSAMKSVRELLDFFGTFDQLIQNEDSQQVLAAIPNWQQVPMDKLYWILLLNKELVRLSSNQLLCPECYSYRTIVDGEHNEVICGRCGLIIEDVTIPAEKRLEFILSFLVKNNFFYG
jgi:DNA-binding HxlR family transcriptional regulator